MNPLFNQIQGMNQMNPFQNVMDRARQIAAGFQNTQQFIQQYLPGVPANMANDPQQILNWLQQTGRVTPQMMQMLNQITSVK